MSETPKIMVTMPVRDRAWVLPYVLRCLGSMNIPDECLSFTFIDDGSTDRTLALLKVWRTKVKERFDVKIIALPNTDGKRITSARDIGAGDNDWQHLCDLRNQMIDHVLASDATHQFSVDSDILVGPDALSHLLEQGQPYVSSVIFNDAHDYGYLAAPEKRHTNGGHLKWQHRGYRPIRTYARGRLVPVDYSGAIYLVTRETLSYGARFEPHQYGEDLGYCLALNRLGIPRFMDTTHNAVHVMVPRRLSECIGVYYAWFGRFIGEQTEVLK